MAVYLNRFWLSLNSAPTQITGKVVGTRKQATCKFQKGFRPAIDFMEEE